MTKVIDKRKITIRNTEFTCIACKLDINISSFLFDPEYSTQNPQNRVGILLSHDDSVMRSDGTSVQMITLLDEDKLTDSESSDVIDTQCTSCGNTITWGYASEVLKSQPNDVDSSTKIDFANTTMAPFCEYCTKLYMKAYEEMKRESTELATHVI